MINLKDVVQNPSILDESLKKRGLLPISAKLISLDKEVKNLLTKIQNIKANCNSLAKKIGGLQSDNPEVYSLKLEVKKLKEQELLLLKQLNSKQEELNNYLLNIPNILDVSVPYGVNETQNKLIRTYLTPRKFNFNPKTHYDLGEKLNCMHLKKAVKLSGSRFNILSNGFSVLERALINFMLDLHTKEHGFVEYSVPVIVSEDALFGTSQLPKFAEDMFKISDTNKWLISTGEIALTNLYREEIIDIKDLPIRVVTVTQCFRKEAGARGKDTKGILRQHQFAKVELVSLVHPDNGLNELEYLTNSAENVLKKLQIPYRVMLLCSGDIGFSSSKTYDIEVWLPSEKRYREISSCSLCTDFQARRMKTKIKDNKERYFIYTLNASGLAIGRTLVAVIENYQQEDGSILVPEVLLPYTNGLKVIKN